MNTQETPTTAPDLFLPSVFAQAESLAKQEGIIPSGQSEQPPYKLEPDDIQGIVELPFDTAALYYKFPDFALDDSESARLCKLWTPVIQRLLGKTRNLDVAVAASTTLLLVIEKSLAFRIAEEERKAKLTQPKEHSAAEPFLVQRTTPEAAGS